MRRSRPRRNGGFDTACESQIPTQMAREHPLKKWFLATALALTAMPAAAHDVAAVSQRPSRPAAPIDPRAVVGLPIFTSDGKEIGKVLVTGTDEDGLAVLVAEFEQAFGIGSVATAIPTDMFVLINGRIVLSITEAEVSQRLDRADRRR